jgi:uncharacterized membrane protein YhhN
MRLRILFLIVLILEIYASIAYHQVLVYITKPLLMPILMLIAYQEGVKNKWLYLALLFSFGGDVFLMFSGTNYFLLGLSSFLIAHVFYIVLFVPQAKFSFLIIAAFGVITAGYLTFLYPHIAADFRPAVIGYCTVITLMGIVAASRKKSSNYVYILVGAILFIISDSLIAFNKFYAPLPYNAFFVMTTYGAAQLLILEGWIKQEGSALLA